MTSKNYLTDALAIVESAENKTKIEIWCNLNRYHLPPELSSLFPEYESFPQYIKLDISMIIMAKINESVGIRECLREWNKDSLPGKAFDDWYDNCEAARYLTYLIEG